MFSNSVQSLSSIPEELNVTEMTQKRGFLKISAPTESPRSSIHKLDNAEKSNFNLELHDDFRLSFNTFSRETSLHGVKQITLASGTLKKALWTLLMVLSFLAMGVQLTKKLKGYFETPVALDMEVQYPSNVTFPAVMLCNANLFRISEATKRKWNMYHLLQKLYDEAHYGSVDGKRFKQLRRIDGAKFLITAAHQKENMILHCLWPDGEICTSVDFDTIITDYGVCYSINDNIGLIGNRTSNVSVPYLAENTGSGYGLYLLLNVEDYEAMAGPQKTVGIKVLIYEQNSVISVAEEAFDVAPGFQTSVGLKKMMTKKLSKDAGGQCGQAPLRLFKNESYSRRICALDQKYWAASTRCQCLSYNMPQGHSSLPICNATQYFTCMLKAMQRAPDVNESQCPQDCVTMEYQQYISFSELSSINIDALLTVQQRADMQLRYLAAREARSRSNTRESESDQRLVKGFLRVYDEIENRSLVPSGNVADTLLNIMRNVTCFHDDIQPFIETSDFCSEDALDSVVMKPLTKLLLPGVIDQGLSLVKQLNHTRSVCRSMEEDIIRHFFSTALSTWLTISSTTDGTNGIPEMDQIAVIVGQQLLVETAKTSIKHLSINLESSIRDFIGHTEFVDSHVAYTEKITSLNEINRTQIIREYLSNTNLCLTNLTKSIPMPIDVTYVNMKLPDMKRKLRECSQCANECMQLAWNFTNIFGKYQELIQRYQYNHTLIVEEIRETCRKFNIMKNMDIWVSKPRKHGSMEYEILKDRVKAFQNGKLTKVQFSKYFLELANGIYFLESIKQYFTQVSEYAKRLQYAFGEAALAIKLLIRYYHLAEHKETLDAAFSDIYQENEDSPVSIPDQLKSANACLPFLDEIASNIVHVANINAQNYLQHFQSLRDHLRMYNSSLQLDENFYGRNLLALNIYLRDKSVEVLVQKESYTFWSLVSDIGGTMGLFLGASLLTVGEILEYILCQCLYIFRARYHQRRSKNSIDTSSSESNHHSDISQHRTQRNMLLRSYNNNVETTSDLHRHPGRNTVPGIWTKSNKNMFPYNPNSGPSSATTFTFLSGQPTVIVTERPWSRKSIMVEI